MKKISDKYKELSKIERNNIQHKYKFINVTSGIDLTDLVQNETLSISTFLRTAQGNITPNSLSLTLSKLYKNEVHNDKILIKDFKHKYIDFLGQKWRTLKVDETIRSSISLGDNIKILDIFSDEELCIFNGIVKDIIEMTNQVTEELQIKIEDNTIKGYDKIVSENIYYENYYIYNSQDKEHSILYKLATKYLEFNESELEIQDIKIGDEHIKIPVFLIKKGTRVIEKIADIVRSIYGNIYVKSENILVINSYFDKSYIKQSDITLGDKPDNYPILDFIEKTVVNSNNNKVEVKYNETAISEEKTVLRLAGQHATKNDGKLIVRKNTNSNEYWKLDFTGIVDLNKTPVVKTYKYNGENKEYITYNEYELEITNNQGKVKFNNSNDFDIFVEEFSFSGKQLFEYKDNSITYTERKIDNIAENLKSVSFEYVVNQKQATELAKHTYYNECRPYKKLKLKTNNLPFLELEDVINIDFKNVQGKYSIIAITQTNTSTELVLKEYKEYEASPYNFINIKSNKLADNKDLIKKIEKEVQDKFTGPDFNKLVGKVTEKFKDEIIETVSKKTQSEFEKIFKEEVKKSVEKIVDSKLNKNWKLTDCIKCEDILSEFIAENTRNTIISKYGMEPFNQFNPTVNKIISLYKVKITGSEFIKLVVNSYQRIQDEIFGNMEAFDNIKASNIIRIRKTETYSIEELKNSNIDYSFIDVDSIINRLMNENKQIDIDLLMSILRTHKNKLPLNIYLPRQLDLANIILRFYQQYREVEKSDIGKIIQGIAKVFSSLFEFTTLLMNTGCIPFFYNDHLYFVTVGDTIENVYVDKPLTEF